jgi:hypothetical protein
MPLSSGLHATALPSSGNLHVREGTCTFLKAQIIIPQYVKMRMAYGASLEVASCRAQAQHCLLARFANLAFNSMHHHGMQAKEVVP